MIREEYKHATIAKELTEYPERYFDGGECPYERKTLEDREVKKAIDDLIDDGKIPKRPPPRRARQK
jgi:hypothetical protein